MANVAVQVPAPAAAEQARQARLVNGGDSIVLPWWPEDIGWSTLADAWSEQQRPGRSPLVLREGKAVPELSIAFILVKRTSKFVGDGGSILPTLQGLHAMARSDFAVQLMLAGRDTGRWRITEYSFTELEHATDGQPTKAEVSMTLKRAVDAVAPIGPVSSKSK